MNRDPVFFIDCTSTICLGLNTGIQRVTRALASCADIFSEVLGVKCIPMGYQFNDFYRDEDAKVVGLDSQMDYEHLSFGYRDIYFCPDAFWTVDIHKWYPFFRSKGMTIATLVYDLIPLTHPLFFNQQYIFNFENALIDIIKYSDLLPCISHDTQKQLLLYCHNKNIQLDKLKCPVVPLAPGISNSYDTGQFKSQNELPESYFLIVGTIEPRRGYLEAIEEYEQYRDTGGTSSLLIIGKPGINSDNIIHKIQSHTQGITWFDNADDNQLVTAYQCADAVICPSHAEGYGLTVSEGLELNGLVFANRLPVFGEFAGSHPYYFDINRKGDLARLLAGAKELDRAKKHLNLGSWEVSAHNIAMHLTKIATFHGNNTVIEVSKNSPEAVRWAHWLIFNQPCTAEDIAMWMQHENIHDMYSAMLFKANALNI